MQRFTPVLFILGSAAIAPCAAFGQQADQLEEIVVTAERRPQNLQETPATVTAVTATLLQQAGVTDTLSLATVVPGLSMSDIGGYSAPFIRGVGTTAVGPGVEPSVATYVDGVYIAAQAGSIFALNNISQIEVDKGPQGTLFGRNATGGVIQVSTRDPSQTPTMDFEAGYGNYGTYQSNIYGSTGITPTLAVDLAGYYRDQTEGWGRYLLTGADAYKDREVAIRSKLLWTPIVDTRVTLSLDYAESKTGDGIIYYPVPGTVGITGQRFIGPYTATGSYSYAHPEQAGGSLKLEQDFGWSKLTSISAYRHLEYYAPFDFDAQSAPLVYAIFNVPDNQLTQEIRLASPDASPVHWIGGAYYFNHRTGFTPITIIEAPLTIQSYSSSTAKSYALFGQVSSEIFTATDLTLGGRYTHDQISDKGRTVINGSPPLNVTSQSTNYNEPSWRASIDHHFNSDVLGYMSYNRGFKGGTYNPQTYSAPSVAPEVLNAYELGVKSEVLDHRLRVNVAGYFNDWKNIQVVEFSAAQQFFVNGPAARIYGLDLDVTAEVAQGFRLSGGVSYAHGRYTKFPNAPSNFVPGTTNLGATTAIDATGNDTVHTPNLSSTLSANYTVPTSFGAIDLSVTNAYISSYFWEPDNNIKEPAVDLLNASLKWTSADKRWDLRFYGQNLTNRFYFVSEESTPLVASGAPAAPRTYGFSIGLHL